MRNKIYYIVCLFLLGMAGTFTSCFDDEESDITTILETEPKEIVRTNVYGLIVDENDRALSNARVVLETPSGPEIIDTDDKGHFTFFKKQVYESAFISVEADGKFDAFRRLAVVANNYNYTVIKMLDKQIVDNFNSSTGGTAENSQGAKMTIPANAIANQDGSVYTGEVQVAMSWINPTATDLSERMVGNYSALDEEGREVGLITMGMINIELLDNAGNELQIKSGSEARLTFPIPAALQSKATSTIPLWYYNEEKGLWIEEGQASLVNGQYEGTVKHFTTWNVDFKGEIIDISGLVDFNTATDTSVSLLNRLQVFICSPTIGERGGYLCPDGQFTFINAPKNESFTIKIIDECGVTIFTMDYGPFDSDQSLGTITVNVPTQNFIEILGQPVDCNNLPIANGLLTIELDNGGFIYDDFDSGSFQLFYDNSCDSAGLGATLIAYDQATLLSSQFYTFSLDADVDLEEIPVCDEAEKFIEFDLDGQTAFVCFDNASAVFSDSLNAISCYNSQNAPSVSFDLTDPVTGMGVYSVKYFYYVNDIFISYQVADPNNLEITITQYGANPGDVLRGTITGNIRSVSPSGIYGPDEVIDGSFKVIRDN